MEIYLKLVRRAVIRKSFLQLMADFQIRFKKCRKSEKKNLVIEVGLKKGEKVLRKNFKSWPGAVKSTGTGFLAPG